MDAEVLIIDKDRAVIDEYRDSPVNAVALDAVNEESLRRILPKTVDAVVIDLGGNIEASILVTSYCRKMEIAQIIVKAETEGHAEILDLVGATKIVFPNKEAAKRITPLMVSSALLNYLPVSGSLVIAEMAIPGGLVGKTLSEADLRRKHELNLISVKNGAQEEYGFVSPDYAFRNGDIGLFSGTEKAFDAFAGSEARLPEKGLRGGIRNLSRLFGLRKK